LRYPDSENRHFFNLKDKAVKDAFACLYPPRRRGRYIGTAWGGLFISGEVFGDTSESINKTKSPRYLFDT